MKAAVRSAHGIRQVAWFDCPGGGQVRVENGVAYLGHMRAPDGTTLLDVRDARRPEASRGVVADPHAARSALPQGAREGRHHARQPRARGRPPGDDDERHPVPVATWKAPGLDIVGEPQPPMTGCHQPSEVVTGTAIPFA